MVNQQMLSSADFAQQTINLTAQDEVNIFFLNVNYMFRWKQIVLRMKILQAISRTTGPNIAMFVLILKPFSC